MICTTEEDFVDQAERVKKFHKQMEEEFGVVWSYTTNFEPYINALRIWFNVNKTRLIEEGYTEEQISEALMLYEKLAKATDRDYFFNRGRYREPKKIVNDMLEGEDVQRRFLIDFTKLYDSVLFTGKIEGISTEFAMTREEAIAQAKRADEAFTKRPDLQKLLADANYSFFTGKTMATAEDLLELELDSFYTEGMPHLTASNGAIGYATKNYMLDRVQEGGTTFTITDMGSGSGATLAGIVLGLVELNKNLEQKIKLRINAIEGCRAFYEVLKSRMIPAIREKVDKLGNIELMTIDMQYGDIPFRIKDMEVEGTPVYTVNYVFHRISDAVKKDICKEIGKKIGEENAAFFLADIYRNTSEMPNRRYFNFALNGILNPGNDPHLMEEVMINNGFVRVITDRDMSQFKGLPKEITAACNSAKEKEQGFFMAAYK